MKKLVILLLCALFFGAGLNAAEAHEFPEAKVLPGDALYPLKLAIESIGTALTLGEDRKAEREISLAEERISETKKLVLQEAKFSLIEKAIQLYGKKMDNALERAEKIAEKNQERADEILKKILNSEEESFEIISGLQKENPETIWTAEKIDKGFEMRKEIIFGIISQEEKDSIKSRLEMENEERKTEINDKISEIMNEREIIRKELDVEDKKTGVIKEIPNEEFVNEEKEEKQEKPVNDKIINGRLVGK